MNALIPLISSLISLLFALAVLDQFLERRKPYQLVWAVGLLTYCIATGAEFVTEAFGVSLLAYRIWYLFGAVLSAAYLGMGTIYLLAPRRPAHIIMLVLLVASLLAEYKVLTAPVYLSLLGETLSGKAFPPGWAGPRLLTPFFNVFGTIALVGGALYSAYIFWRKRTWPHRVVSNILIAAGAMITASGGSLARLGSPQYLYLSELIGIIVIFIGFLRSQEVFATLRLPLMGRRRGKPSPPAPSP